MRSTMRHTVPVFLFVIFVILRGTYVAAQTPSTTSTSTTTTTNGSVSVTIPLEVVAPPGCSVAFSSSGSVPVISVSGCTASTPPPNPPPPPTPTPTPTPDPGPSKRPANIAAFPSAQGGGAASVGGRGGIVIEVTNLNDSGPGSLRACEMASGPRTCVFRVAGLIPVTSGDIRVSNPYLTVACQTAPGEVIIGGPNTRGAVMGISTHDVIVRGCVFSPDNASTTSGPNTGQPPSGL